MVTYEDIIEARGRIGDRVGPSPCFPSPGLSERFGHAVWIKAELLQRTGSFKVRGAVHWIRTSTEEQRRRGLVTVSAGNHAQALAWAAREVGVPVTVLMPQDASPMKIEATKRYGAEVILHGVIRETLARMEEVRRERGLTLVHPYDDPRIIAGQGTVGLELAEQCPEVHTVVVPVGGGGLVSGIAVALKHARPSVRVIGVEPEGAATLSHAWLHGRPEPLSHVETVAASLGAGIAGEHTFALSREHVDDIVTVDEREIFAGLESALVDGKLYAEPGAAVGLAALASGKVGTKPSETTVVVVTGGNLDVSKLCTLSEGMPCRIDC